MGGFCFGCGTVVVIELDVLREEDGTMEKKGGRGRSARGVPFRYRGLFSPAWPPIYSSRPSRDIVLDLVTTKRSTVGIRGYLRWTWEYFALRLSAGLCDAPTALVGALELELCWLDRGWRGAR